MNHTELQAKVAELEAALAAAKAAKGKTLAVKISAKGAVSVYGLGRFPVTLYGSQWEALLNFLGCPSDNPVSRAIIEGGASVARKSE
jgi:hypothetical protein